MFCAEGSSGPGAFGAGLCGCPAPHGLTRRGFFAGAFAAGVAGGASSATAQAGTARIDFHHHVAPPTHMEALRKANLGEGPAMSWTPQKSIDEMDKAGVTTALLSITTPAVAFLPRDEARRVARECNEYSAKLRGDFPGRFGMLAALPLPYVDDCLAEIDYCCDTLKAEGFGVMTSYFDKWLGHRDFWPVIDAFEKRRAVVHVHPTTANCCVSTLPDIPPSLIEYSTDTTRAIASMIFTGASARAKNASFVFSHGGGTMPSVIERFNNLPNSDKRYRDFTPEGVVAELRRFHYDTAIVTHPAPLSALTSLVPMSQIVFGSDFPFRTATKTVEGLKAYFDPARLAVIDHENALRLLPTLRRG
jgi:predicted TIM-barrel fold metal-dependent hydrolase